MPNPPPRGEVLQGLRAGCIYRRVCEGITMLHDDVHGDRVRWGSNRVRCVSATGPGVSMKVKSSASAVLGASAYAAKRKESRAPTRTHTCPQTAIRKNADGHLYNFFWLMTAMIRILQIWKFVGKLGKHQKRDYCCFRVFIRPHSSGAPTPRTIV